MSDTAIRLEHVGKMYKLYGRQSDKVLDALGLGRLLPWHRNRHREFWALRGLNLDIPRGQRLGIIGRNGSGKSTLLKVIAGNVAATEGRVTVRGAVQALMELGTGFHPEFTGRQNIRASLAYHGLTTSRIRSVEEEILDFTELEEFIDQPVKVFSSGMYARLAFAVATVLEPEILIIDEILGAGDASFTRKCMLRMKRITEERGATVLFVSHDMGSVIELCSRAILLNRGVVMSEGEPLAISKIYNKMIREEDEVTLRAREYQLRKRDYRAIEALGKDQQAMIFRLRCNEDHPRGRHLVYRLALQQGARMLGEIAVGGPMDNDLAAANHVIDGAGLMDWGPSQRLHGRYCRAYQNEDGIHQHAPFQMTALKSLLDDGEVMLVMDATFHKGDAVHVELFVNDRYERLATLGADHEQHRVVIPRRYLGDSEVAAPAARMRTDSGNIQARVAGGDGRTASALAVVDESAASYEEFASAMSLYGNQMLIVDRVELFGHGRGRQRVFQVGESMEMVVHFHPRCRIPRFVLCCCVMTTDGRPAGQVFCDSRDLGVENVDQAGTISVCFEPLRFGAGEYMVSIGLFKDYETTQERENESYCVVDRAVFFKVTQPDVMKKGIGSFAQRAVFRAGGRQATYDAADHFSA